MRGVPIYRFTAPGYGVLDVYTNKVVLRMAKPLVKAIKAQVCMKFKTKVYKRIPVKDVNTLSVVRLKLIFRRMSKLSGHYPILWSQFGLIVGGSVCNPMIHPEESVLSRILDKGVVIWVRSTVDGEVQHTLSEAMELQRFFPSGKKVDREYYRSEILATFPELLKANKIRLAVVLAHAMDMKQKIQPMDSFNFEYEEGIIYATTVFGDKFKVAAWADGGDSKGRPYQDGPIRWAQIKRQPRMFIKTDF